MEKYFTYAKDALLAELAEKPKEEAHLHSQLGSAYAGLGLTKDALREGQLGVDLLPVTTEPRRGLYRLEDLARINVMVEKYDEAIGQIKRLLGVHGRLSIPLLKLDPAWAPLREHPDFKGLVESSK